MHEKIRAALAATAAAFLCPAAAHAQSTTLPPVVVSGTAGPNVLGVQIHHGKIDNEQVANVAGEKGALRSSSLDRSDSRTLHGQDIVNLTPRVALVLGAQYLIADRDRRQRAARRAAAPAAGRTAVPPSGRLPRRPERRVGAGGLLGRQRQHAGDRAVRAGRPARRLG